MKTRRTPSLFGIIQSKPFLVVSLIILGLLIFALSREVMRRLDVQNEISTLREEIEQLEERNTELADLIQYFESVSFKEREARLKLGLSKEGEKMIAFTGENIEIEGQPSVNEGTKEESSEANAPKWWNYFFSNK